MPRKKGNLCPRCDGLMFEERVPWANPVLYLYHCSHCGNYLDALIIYNRLYPEVISEAIPEFPKITSIPIRHS